jgi:hypothetical protein
MATWTKISARTVVSVQAATEGAPTGSDGLLLESTGGFTLGVKLASGTFASTIANALVGYIQLDDGEWYRAPELDLDIPAEAVGLDRVAFVGWVVANPRDRVAHVANGMPDAITLRYSATEFSGRSI